MHLAVASRPAEYLLSICAKCAYFKCVYILTSHLVQQIIKKGGRPQPLSLLAERMQQPHAKRHPLLQI